MLMRTDPFRDLDRFAQQMLGTDGTLARPSVMPMDAWRDGDTFHVEFDLPGVDPGLDRPRRRAQRRHGQAERPSRASDAELIAAERPEASSAGSSSSATTSTPSTSRRTTTRAC